MVCCRGDHFLIETQTFDTFLCTFLEIFWSYGGELSIDEEYSVHDENRVKQALFQAFWILREMFKNGLIPKDSTLDAGVFGRRFGQADKTGASAGGSWMCARHWYSSFIDVLTARNSDEASDWAWKPEASQALEVLQIPTSIQQIVFAKLEGREVMHHSCWGDWHLGVLKSSENVDLAIEILNNIMSSHKICEGAFRCAFVPTVEQFYKTYGTAKCFNVPERGPLIKTPNLTFTGLRDGFMKNARNRSEKMFDYRHCMRELHSVLTLVHNNSDIGDEELGREVIQVVGRIKELKYQALLLH